MSTGMAHSFGKPIGVACQVKPREVVFEIFTNRDKIVTAKKALKRASHKIPNHYHIVETFLDKVKKA